MQSGRLHCLSIHKRRQTLNNQQNTLENREESKLQYIQCSIWNYLQKNTCGKVYIGETKRLLKFRLADHRGYIVNKDTTTATGHHFNLPGHNLADLSITVVKQVRKNDLI